MTFPDDSIQSLVGDWWLHSDQPTLKRGSLITAFVPYVDQQPYCFVPVGRSEPTEHTKAEITVTPLKVGQKLEQAQLPVAAMTPNNREVWAAYRAKRRPCIVLGLKGKPVDKSLTKNKPKRATSPTIIVAPFYGVDQNTEARAGYSDAFVERVKHLVYPQFHWDMLPLPGACESILRLDQIQPIGITYPTYWLSGYCLSNSGLNVIDDLIRKNLLGLDFKSDEISTYMELIADLETSN